MYGKTKTPKPTPQDIQRAKRYIKANPEQRQRLKAIEAKHRGDNMVGRFSSRSRSGSGHRPRCHTTASSVEFTPRVRPHRRVRYTSPTSGHHIDVDRGTGNVPLNAAHSSRRDLFKGHFREVIKSSFIMGTISPSLETFPEITCIWVLHPMAMGGLPAMTASTYAKWRPKSLKIEYLPIVSATTSGAIFMAFIDDPNELIQGSGVTAVTQLSTTDGYKQSEVWEECTALWTFSDNDDEWYSTMSIGPDPFDVVPGFLVAGTASVMTTTGGYLRATVEMEFCEEAYRIYVTPSESIPITLTWTMFSATTTDAVVATSDVAAAGRCTIGSTSTLGEGKDSSGIIPGRINNITGFLPGIAIRGSEHQFSFIVGQLIFVRWETVDREPAGGSSDLDVIVTIHATLAAAMNSFEYGGVVNSGVANPLPIANDNQLCYVADNLIPATGSVSIVGVPWCADGFESYGP